MGFGNESAPINVATALDLSLVVHTNVNNMDLIA
jgi:hypothetical protein